MKSDAEFEQLYELQLVPALRSLEQLRKAAVNSFVIAIGWVVTIGPLLFVAAKIQHPAAFLIIIPSGIAAFLKFSDHRKKRALYIIQFKEKIIGEIVKMIDPCLNYLPGSFITVNEYSESDIFREKIDRYTGDDMVEGELRFTECRFSELHHLEKQVSYDSKGNRRETWVTVFKGIFFVADFNKNFNGRTYVLPDAGRSFLGIGRLMEKWMMGRGELVKLENPDFEKVFTVYGTDQVEARYILSPALMERLIQFQQKVKTPSHISFIHSKVFIALSIREQLFEPNIFSSGIKSGYLRKYFQYLNLAVGIVDDLNLNTRVWGKQ